MAIGKTARFILMSVIVFVVALIAGNTVAMNALNSKLSVDISVNFYRLSGIYINPFSFLILYKEYGKLFPALFKQPVAIYTGCVAVGLFGPVGLKYGLKKKERTSEGSAKWATKDDLDEKKLLVKVSDSNKPNLTGVICGTWYTGLVNYETVVNSLRTLTKRFKLKDDAFFSLVDWVCAFLLISRYYIIDNAPTHGIMIAPSRSGKGIGPVLQTLLFWKGSMIVSDLKRENIRKTGAYRKHVLKHNIIEFAPTDTRPTARFNPLNEVRWGTANEGKDVGNLVTLLVGEPEGKDAHWKSNASSLIQGVVTHLKYKHAFINAMNGKEPGDPGYIETSMPLVYEFLTTTEFDKQLGEYMSFKDKLTKELQAVNHFPAQLWVHNETSVQAMIRRVVTEEKAQEITTFSVEALKTPKKHPVVNSSFQSFISKPDDEGGSVLSTAVTALSMFSEKIIADNTCTSDWITGDIRGLERPTDLFLVVPPSDLGRVAKLFSFIFETIIQKGTEDEEKAQSQHRTLLLIDEWPAFGKMDTLVRELGYIASYGLKCFLICQGLDQVKAIYQNMSFMTNCETQIYFAPRDEVTPKFLSEKLDKQTLESKQKSSSGFFSKTNYTYSEKGRLLLTAGEATSLGNNSVMIIESLNVKSPKNKWFINGDMVARMNAGKTLDPLKRIGMRDVTVDEQVFDSVRFLTIHDIDVVDADSADGAEATQHGDLYNVWSGLLKTPDEGVIQFGVNMTRLIYCLFRDHNEEQLLTRTMKGYKSITEKSIKNFIVARRDFKFVGDEMEKMTKELLLQFLDVSAAAGEEKHVVDAYLAGNEWLKSLSEEQYSKYAEIVIKAL